MRIVLAENKRARVDIVISPSADRVVRFAASEMRTYLNKISGADFRVIEKDNSSASSRAAICITADSAAGGKAADAFAIETKAGQVLIRGDKGRSALYGVYAFLESLGCRFVEPGRETIPSARTLVTAAINRKCAAAFARRNIFRIQIFGSKTAEYDGLEPANHFPQIDWMAKRRLNHYVFYVDYYRYDLWMKYKHLVLDALLDRGFDIEVTHHSIHYFCPPDENHDYGNYGPATYRRTNPGWYIGEQTRIEKPAVQNLIRDRYLEYLRKNPELSMVGLWPDDTSMNSSYRGLSPTDGYMRFWNNMAKALAAEFPQKLLSILAYWELLKPPQKVVPASNLHCWFCPIDANYMYPVADNKLSRKNFRTTGTLETNSKYLELLKPWIRKMPPGRVSCFEYYGWQGPLTPLAGKMKQDLSLYRDLKLGGVYGWSGFTLNLMGADCRWARDLYVFSNLLWNPDQNISALETEWAQGVFGKAAPDILDFYSTLKQAHDKETRKGLLTRAAWVSLDLLHRLQKILAAARRKADAPEARGRVDLLERVACQGCTEKVFRHASDWNKFL